MFPVVELEVRFTLPPAQKVVGPLAVIVGTGTEASTVTVVVEDVTAQLPVNVTL